MSVARDKSITFGFIMRIYLLGFMGTGKSTLGHQVAVTLGTPLFDTDAVIESQAGMSIADIFKTYGEAHFRHLEADVLRQTTFYPKSLNVTGGGLPCFDDNMTWMIQNGITMYIHWPDEVLKKHLLQLQPKRPLLEGLTDEQSSMKISDLLAIRKPVYEMAAITIEMTGNIESDYQLLEKACKYIW